MEVAYRTANGRLTFKVTGETTKALFVELAKIQEVFEGEQACGVCNSPNIRLQHRKVDAFDYYELVCGNHECRARFQFGQAREGGGLFPKRKDEDGNWLPNRGWTKWVKPGDGGAPASAPSHGREW